MILFKILISIFLPVKDLMLNLGLGQPFFLSFCYAPDLDSNVKKWKAILMTDKTKYSNISVSKETYSSLQKLSKEILPNASLSISKTVSYLVDCKIKEKEMTIREAERITGGLDLWGQLEKFTPPKKIIDQVINNTNNKGDNNGKK